MRASVLHPRASVAPIGRARRLRDDDRRVVALESDARRRARAEGAEKLAPPGMAAGALSLVKRGARGVLTSALRVRSGTVCRASSGASAGTSEGVTRTDDEVRDDVARGWGRFYEARVEVDGALERGRR